MSSRSFHQEFCQSCNCWEDGHWASLEKSSLQLLNETKFCREFKSGEILFNEGDVCKGIYCIKSGLVVVRKASKDGDYILLRRLGQPGTTLGYRPFLADDCHRGTARVIKPSIICHIDRITLMQLLHSNPNLGLRFLKQAAIDLGNAEKEIMDPFLSARTKLVHAILLFKEQHANQTAKGQLEIELPLHRDDLAAIAGIHPESVTKVFRAFKDEGLIEVSNHTLKIKNIDQLFAELNEEYV